MNKFGDNRNAGPAGPPGQNAFDVTTWTPKALLRMFREDMKASFYFKTESDCILYNKKGEPIGLQNHGNSDYNAMCLSHFHKPRYVRDGVYGLPLNHTIYKITDIGTALADPTIMYVAFTFKITEELEEGKDYVIFTNLNNSRGVVISKKTINILGAQVRQELTYNHEEWNTIIVQWSNVSGGDDTCFFYLNENRGFIRPRKYKEDLRDLYIGGHPTIGNCAPIYLTRFEVYLREWSAEKEEITNYLVPEDICKLLLNDIMIDRV